MVSQYKTQRQRVFERIIPVLKSRTLEVDKDFFISSMALDLACKTSLIEEAIDLCISIGLIKNDKGVLKVIISKEDMLKSDAELEADSEFKKMGV